MSEQVGNPRVQGSCPSCGGSLFLGNSGYVTCCVIGCKNPSAPHELLEGKGDVTVNALDRLTLEVRRLRQVQAVALIKGTGVKADVGGKMRFAADQIRIEARKAPEEKA